MQFELNDDERWAIYDALCEMAEDIMCAAHNDANVKLKAEANEMYSLAKRFGGDVCHS